MYQANVAVGRSFMTDVADLACRFMSLRSSKATDVLRCREMTRRANNRHLTPGYVATAYTRSDAYFQHKSVGITYLGAGRNADA